MLYDRLAGFEIGPEETLNVGLTHLGYGLGDVCTAVISHLHQNHVGGVGALGHADIVVSQTEWNALSGPRPEMRGLMTRHIDLPGLRWQRIAPEPTGDPGLSPFRQSHDLFGDSSLVLLPTPGRTADLMRPEGLRSAVAAEQSPAGARTSVNACDLAGALLETCCGAEE